MPTENLTAARLQRLAGPKAGAGEFWDERTPGLCLRVYSSGRKTWSFRYRPQSGDGQKRLGLGAYPGVSLAEARSRAIRCRVEVSSGADPQAERHSRRNSLSLDELVGRYLDEEVAPKKKSRTYELYRYYFYKIAGPTLGSRKAITLTHSDLAKLHRDIGATRQVTANRTIVALSGVFTYAAKHKLVPQGFNPTRDVEKFREQLRERYLSSDELARLGDALRVGETAGLPWPRLEGRERSRHDRRPENQRTVLSPYVTAALRLLLFTGCRLREILHLRWTEVDLERGFLLLSDSKTGRKAVVLNAAALAVLTGLPRLGGFVVAGDSDLRPRKDLKRGWRLVTIYGRLEGVRIHDLRHTHASIGAGAGLGLPIIGKLLGHRNTETTARYAHLDAGPLRRASDHIGLSLANAMGEHASV